MSIGGGSQEIMRDLAVRQMGLQAKQARARLWVEIWMKEFSRSARWIRSLDPLLVNLLLDPLLRPAQ